MMFVKNVKEYKVSEKFVKSVGAEVYSRGFPVSEIKKGSLSLEFVSTPKIRTGYKLAKQLTINCSFCQ